MYLLDSPPYNYKMPEYTDTRIKNKKNRGDGWPHITQTEAMDGLTSLKQRQWMASHHSDTFGF
jgi:hypothetical protein